MSLIRESIVTTASPDGRVHVAPLGLIADGDHWIIAPFSPSTTLDNLRAVPFAVASHTDDVRVFAGCLTGRHDWPTTASDHVPVPRLANALAHEELVVDSVTGDAQRPRFRCRVVHRATHAAFAGHNRAQAAVIEGAILVSRLRLLPREKIEQEIAALAVIVDKTAGEAEREAWSWLAEKVRAFYAASASRTGESQK